MIEFGNGFTWSDTYFLIPSHIRRFYFSQLVEFKKKQAEQIKKAQSGGKGSKVRMR